MMKTLDPVTVSDKDRKGFWDKRKKPNNGVTFGAHRCNTIDEACRSLRFELDMD